MKIIFGLSRSKSPFAIFSKSIMEIEKRPFSHVFVLFEEPVSKIPVVFHAAKGFVHFMPLSRFEQSNEIVKRYEVNFEDDKFKDLWTYMVENAGVKYSRLQIISIFVSKIFKANKGFVQNKSTEMICSELCLMILNQLNIKGYERSQDDITPSEFDAWISTLSDWYPEKIKEME